MCKVIPTTASNEILSLSTCVCHAMPAAAISQSDMTLRGQVGCGSQYHFTMETQTSLVVPEEGETYSVYSSTQWTGFIQIAVANILGIPNSR
jgi:xanthine dehydrogenase molybdopterin-binding subunit B